MAVAARYGRDAPLIDGGLIWLVHAAKPDATGMFPLHQGGTHGGADLCVAAGRLRRACLKGHDERRRNGPTTRKDLSFSCSKFPPAACGFEGRPADVRIPTGQISFEIYTGSQFATAERRRIAQSVISGDVVLLPAGTYNIVSNYGDGNSVVRSDVNIDAGKLTDIVVTHRAAVITLKLVNNPGGEALANTQWTVLTPGGDVIKESIGAFPRIVLAEGDYHVIARNKGKNRISAISKSSPALTAKSKCWRGEGYAAFFIRATSGGTASSASAASATSSGIVCCLSLPRRRIETVRSEASFLPTMCRAGTMAMRLITSLVIDQTQVAFDAQPKPPGRAIASRA